MDEDGRKRQEKPAKRFKLRVKKDFYGSLRTKKWRNGLYNKHRYHSIAHEALGGTQDG